MFHSTAQKLAPRAYKLRDALLGLWQPFALSHDWVMPDKHHVHKRVWQTKDTVIRVPLLNNRSFTFRNKENKGTETGLSIVADLTHSIDGFVVREMQARCNYDRDFLLNRKALLEQEMPPNIQRTTFSSLSVLDVLTDVELINLGDNAKMQLLEGINYVLARKSFELVTVHDEFKCLANHVQHMREHYNRILWELYHSELLFDLIEQISDKRFATPEYDESVANAILINNYAIN